MIQPPPNSSTPPLSTDDTLAVIRARLIKKHGSLWKAAASYRDGHTTTWLTQRLAGIFPIDPDLAAWLLSETGIELPKNAPVKDDAAGDCSAPEGDRRA